MAFQLFILSKYSLHNSHICLPFFLQLPYLWTVEYNNRAAMKKPSFDITMDGILPTKLTTFHVKLECTGELTAEVKILLNLNVSAISHRHNDTFLVLRRNKFCVKKVETPIGE